MTQAKAVASRPMAVPDRTRRPSSFSSSSSSGSLDISSKGKQQQRQQSAHAAVEAPQVQRNDLILLPAKTTITSAAGKIQGDHGGGGDIVTRFGSSIESSDDDKNEQNHSGTTQAATILSSYQRTPAREPATFAKPGVDPAKPPSEQRAADETAALPSLGADVTSTTNDTTAVTNVMGFDADDDGSAADNLDTRINSIPAAANWNGEARTGARGPDPGDTILEKGELVGGSSRVKRVDSDGGVRSAGDKEGERVATEVLVSDEAAVQDFDEDGEDWGENYEDEDAVVQPGMAALGTKSKEEEAEEAMVVERVVITDFEVWGFVRVVVNAVVS